MRVDIPRCVGTQLNDDDPVNRVLAGSGSLQSVPPLLQGADHMVDGLQLGAARLPSVSKMPDQFGLAMWANLAIARERRQHLLVPQILAPSLELLGGLTP